MFALQEKKPNKAKWLAIVYFSLLVFHEISLLSQFKDAHFTGTVIDLNVVTSEPGALPIFQALIDFREHGLHTKELSPTVYSHIEIGQDFTVSIPYKPLFTGWQADFYPSLSELPSKAELMFMGLLKLLTLGMTGLYLSYRRVA